MSARTTKSLMGLFSRLNLGTAFAPTTATSSSSFSSILSRTPTSPATTSPLLSSVRYLSTTSALDAKAAGKQVKGAGKKKGKKKKKGKGFEKDPRILNLRSSIPRAVPSPLRFGRNRYLRHWTIHRAWLLYQRQQRDKKMLELERMYNSMHNACEELRHTSGPGLRDEGYLYRVALGKQGIFGKNSIPIEYARLQTETPAREPWNHDWKR